MQMVTCTGKSRERMSECMCAHWYSNPSLYLYSPAPKPGAWCHPQQTGHPTSIHTSKKISCRHDQKSTGSRQPETLFPDDSTVNLTTTSQFCKVEICVGLGDDANVGFMRPKSTAARLLFRHTGEHMCMLPMHLGCQQDPTSLLAGTWEPLTSQGLSPVPP